MDYLMLCLLGENGFPLFWTHSEETALGPPRASLLFIEHARGSVSRQAAARNGQPRYTMAFAGPSRRPIRWQTAYNL